MVEDPLCSFMETGSGHETYPKTKRTPINNASYSDDELLPKRFPKRDKYEKKFFDRDEQSYVQEEGSQNSQQFNYDTTNFSGFGNSDEYHISRLPKAHSYENKFFIREENEVYEDKENLSSVNETEPKFDDKNGNYQYENGPNIYSEPKYQKPFSGFGNSDEYHISRLPKAHSYENKFFIREENEVYEDKENLSSVNETEHKFDDKNGNYQYENGPNIYSEPKYQEPFNQFSHENYDLFNHQKEASSEEDYSELDDEDVDGDDLHGGSDADDEHEISELDENDIEGIDIKEADTSKNVTGPNLEEPPFFGDNNLFEKNRHLFEEVTRRTKRVFRKTMMPNPLKVGIEKKPKEDPWKGTPLEKDFGLKMPPEPPNDFWYPKPGDPEYLGPLLADPKEKWAPWFKTVPDFISEEETSETAGSLNSDYITESSKEYSTETYIESDEYTTCPSENPYPVIPKEFFEKPMKYDLDNEFQRMPENNPEVEIWFDCKGREFMDMKNEKGEWVTVEQIIPEYPPKPKHPDRWEIVEEPKKKPDNCTCGEYDFTGWYDEHSKFKAPESNQEHDISMAKEEEDFDPNNFSNQNKIFENGEPQNTIDKGTGEFKNNIDSSIFPRKDANLSENNFKCQDEKNNLVEEKTNTYFSSDVSKTKVVSNDGLQSRRSVISDGGNTSDSDGSSGDENNSRYIASNNNGSTNKTNKSDYNSRPIQYKNDNLVKNSSNHLKNNDHKENILNSHQYNQKFSNSTKFTNHKLPERKIIMESYPMQSSFEYKTTKTQKLPTKYGTVDDDLLYPNKVKLILQKKNKSTSMNRNINKEECETRVIDSIPTDTQTNRTLNHSSLRNSLCFVHRIVRMKFEQLAPTNYKYDLKEQPTYYRLFEDSQTKLLNSNKCLNRLSLTRI